MKLVVFILLFPLLCHSQYKLELNKKIPSLVSSFLSGAFDGAADGLQFRYEGQNKFWQPDISWKNKYKNNDPSQGAKFFGSTSFLVWTTDGWHLMKFGRDLFTTGAIIFNFGEKKKWYYYLIDGAIFWSINRVGFNIVYEMF